MKRAEPTNTAPAKANKAPAAPAKAANAAPAKAPQSSEFGVVPGSLQEKLLAKLRKHLNQPVALSKAGKR